MSDNNWFSHGGSLDGSPDNSNTYGSNTVDSGSSGSTFIKPVKGLNGSSSAPVRREPAPVYAQPAPVAPVPVATAMPENRCIRCGVAIPAGSTLCRNCYSAQNNAVGAGVQTQPGSGSSKKLIFIISGAAVLTVVIIVSVILALFVFGHKLSGRYSYTESGVEYALDFSLDGSVTLVAKSTYPNYQISKKGSYHWNSNEGKYNLEFSTSILGTDFSVGTLTAEKTPDGLLISYMGESLEFKKV